MSQEPGPQRPGYERDSLALLDVAANSCARLLARGSRGSVVLLREGSP